jgi:hypothetical protein
MNDNPLDSVAGGQVTIADLYRALTDLNKNVSAVLTKIEVIETKNGIQQNTSNDHEQRLRQAEQFIQELKGKANATRNIAASLGTAAGLISGVVATIVAHLH